MSQQFDIAIIIPSFNEEKYISKCIDSIIHQTYPFEKIEVIICDGKSTDKTPLIIEEYAKKHPNIFYYVNEQQTTPFALNLGIEKATSPIKMILGSHSELSQNYIEKCLEIFSQNQEIDCLGGIIENVYENKQAEIIGLAQSSPFGVGNAHFRTGAKSGYVDTVAFGAYKQSVFDTCGLFDTSLKRNQDDEFNFRLLKNNQKIWLDLNLKINYFVRSSYTKLFRQYFQYGYWKVFVNKKHKTVTTVRQLIPFFFVGYLILLPLNLLFGVNVFLLSLIPLALYFIAAIYFVLKKTKNIGAVFTVTYVFLTLHLSYGLGYLKGIVDFIIFNKKPDTHNPNITR